MSTAKLGVYALLLAASFVGCHKAPARMTADVERLQGYWEGSGPAGECSVTISGNSLIFRQMPDFWYETIFTIPFDTDLQQLHATIIKDSTQQPRDIGRVVVAIYKFEDGTLKFGLIDDFDEPLAEPVTDDWDQASDIFEFKRAQLQEPKP